ncbi:hypothetical protein BpHYR1_010548 [Brachionus plicatilis]|uniref:Uncharacterized protein n=1 Tax=Brachionus plicatilis TaxID=10195 RepID=A0A3M7T9I6_BRAPC|nr:hypothetical protein BpHYR1_010548 [Brachionus plicatilis]
MSGEKLGDNESNKYGITQQDKSDQKAKLNRYRYTFICFLIFVLIARENAEKYGKFKDNSHKNLQIQLANH